MKNKFLLWIVFLIVLFVCFIMPIFADNEENMLDEVYLGCMVENENDPKGTIKNPVATFAEAFGIVKNHGTIVMQDNIKWDEKNNSDDMNDWKAMQQRGKDFMVTIDGRGKGITCESSNTTIRFATCAGVILTNMKTSVTIYACGSPIIITGDSKLDTVYGGMSSNYHLEAFESDTCITLESGIVNNIYGGNRNSQLKGNTEINIIGGIIKNSIISGGNRIDRPTSVSGNSTINISGNVTLEPNVIISTNCAGGYVGGEKTINIDNSKILISSICDADRLNIINSAEVTAKKLESSNLNAISSISIDKTSIFTASTGNKYTINNELAGDGKIVLNKESYFSIGEVAENTNITIKTDKPYIDKKGNTHDLLIKLNDGVEKGLSIKCFALEKKFDSEESFILVCGDDNKSIYIKETSETDPNENPDDDSGENPGDDSGEDPDDDSGENPGDDSGEDPDDDSGESPGDDSGKDPDDDSGENSNEGSGESPNEDSKSDSSKDPNENSDVNGSNNKKKNSNSKSAKTKSLEKKNENIDAKKPTLNLEYKAGYFQIYEETLEGKIIGVEIGRISENNINSIVMAIPKPGYAFSFWSDGVTFPIRLNIDSKDIIIKANFEEKTELEENKDSRLNNLNLGNNEQRVALVIVMILSNLLNYIF